MEPEVELCHCQCHGAQAYYDDYVTEYGLVVMTLTETFNSTAILPLNSESHAMISISRGQP